jgi:predicted esterase
MKTLHSSFVLSLTLLGFACSEATPGDDGASGGGTSTGGMTTGGSGGSAPAGGTLSTGGIMNTGGTGIAGGGGTATGGSAGSAMGGATNGGSGGTGGSGAGAGQSGSAGSGGNAMGGRGGSGGVSGSSGSGGSGGTSTTAMPSPGCGKSGRPANGRVEVTNTSLHMFPTNYDGMRPCPLLIALHACGNPNTEFVNLTNNTGFATDYVRTFPNTPDSGQCWSSYNADIQRLTEQFDEILNTYCIDMNRVFGTGHSSGAQFLVNVLSHLTDAQHIKFRGVAPVAADPYNVALPTPVMYIAGQNDTQRSATSASNTVARFRTANMCQTTSMDYTAVMECNSTDSGRPLVDPGCIIYDGCTVPTIWCSHNDPSYSGTQHGVPCFAMTAMFDFFAGL